MYQVRDLRIRNEHIRNHLCLDDPLDIIRKRQFAFLGKLARQPEEKLTRKLLGCWIGATRVMGRPQMTLRHPYVETLRAMIPDMLVPDPEISDLVHIDS